MAQGRIQKALSGFYYVQTESGLLTCRARGKFRKEGLSPLVGDWAEVRELGNGEGFVEKLLPRRNAFTRPAVANIDQLVVIASGAIPVTDPFLVDRIIALAETKQCEPVICINKWDLVQAEELYEIYTAAGFHTLKVSAATGQGIEELRGLLAGKVSAFTGNSGVGKSSILNALEPDFALATGEISEKLGRGRHTTRHVELYELGEDTYIADTPGFASFDIEMMQTIDKEQLQYDFIEFAPYLGSCRFNDCAHLKEPGCAVTAALSEGKIGESRYSSYVKLYELTAQHKPWEIKQNNQT